MFPFPENYVPLEVTNKLTLTSQQKEFKNTLSTIPQSKTSRSSLFQLTDALF